MFVLRDAESMRQVAQLGSSEPQGLIASRVEDLSQYEGYSLEELVVFIVLEPGDTVAMLDAELGISIREDIPCWELLEEHPGCYEMVIVLSDDGFGAEIFIPKNPGIDPELLV